jgi:predicted NBD/HSP70 family sugar kinase
LAVIGIDLGGTKTAGLIFYQGCIEDRYRLKTDARSQESVLQGLLEVCSRLLESASFKKIGIEAIGLGIAGFPQPPPSGRSSQGHPRRQHRASRLRG